MKVCYNTTDQIFHFHDLDTIEEEPKQIKRELCKLLMHDERFSLYAARVQVVQDTVLFHPKNDLGRQSIHLGLTVDLRFEDPAGCALFKLAFLDQDEYIPWRNQG